MSSGVEKIIKFLGLKSNVSPVQSCVGAGCQQSHDHQNGTSLQTSSAKHELQIEYELTNDQKNELSTKSSLNTRLKTIKELEELIECQRLVDYSVKYILTETSDLLDENQPKDVRHIVWKLYQCLISGRADRLIDLRPIFWNMISTKDSSDEDIPLRLKLLIAVTDNGKNNECIETKVGPLLIEWFDKIAKHFQRSVGEYLTLLVNVIKYNSSYLDQKAMADIIDKTYTLTKTANEELIYCYQIFEAIVCHSTIPSISLTHFVIVLCKGVKTSLFNEICLKIMRNLLASHLGHSCVDTLRYLLNDQTNHEDIPLLVGAVNFISVFLWEQTRVQSIRHTPNAILPAFKSVLQCRHQLVALEVSSSLICLVDNQRNTMSDHTWDLMFDICEEIVSNYEICVQNSGLEFNEKFHQFLDTVEDLNDKKQFFGDTNRLFNILEKCSLSRSEQSGRRLIQFRAQSINPNKEHWIESLKHLIETYYKRENRTYVRIQALDILSEFVRQYRYIHEELIFERIIIPYFSNIENESDVNCRQRAVQMIIDFANDSNSAKRCLDLLDILDRVCKRPFDPNCLSAGSKSGNTSENDCIDVKIAIKGLIAIFKSKLFSIPGLTAIQAFKIIVSHLSSHYNCVDFNPSIGQIGSAVKQEIFDLLLSIRANSSGQIGVFSRTSESKNTPKHSLFIVCERNQMSPNTSTSASPVVSATTTPQTANPLSPPPSPILHSVNTNPTNLWTLSFQDMFKVLVNCLNKERDWTVLKLVLNALPKFFKNKAIILSGSASVAIDLCDALCSLIAANDMPTKLILPNDQKLSKADFQSFVYPSLSAMVGYQSELKFRQQLKIINCLQNGLVSVSGKTSVLRQCILSLTICAVEMQDAMTKCLPETLLSLSKISATVPLSIPKLEFLSNVILLPRLYQSFTMDQYMSVFAIALSYTNPFKFNEYTVALAHRVIAIWFLKCRLPCRKSIVPFIIKGLQTNVIQEELNHSNTYSDAQRLRSSSLNTDQTINHKKLEARLSLQSSPPPMPSTPHSSHSHFSFSFSSDSIAQHNQLSHHSSQMANINENVSEFQEFRHELVETCMDMLASYTFGQCSTVPLKSPMVEPLLDRSKSETWIVGHKLITITTSGCGSRAVSNGLCEKCLNLCRNDENNDSFTEDIQTNSDVFQSSFESKSRSESTTSTDSSASRRRHQSEIGHMFRQPPRLQSGAYDDSFLKPHSQRGSTFPTTTLCSCWCQGWAEILIRRPTGVSSWITRLQNSLGNFPYSSSPPDELPDLTSLLRPNRTREPSSEPSMDSQMESDSKTNSFEMNESENDVFKRGNSANSSPMIEDSINGSINPLNNQNGAESPYTFKPVESPLVNTQRTSPFQPVSLSRAQSFGSRIRSDFSIRQRLLDRKEFKSNDLESNIELSSQRNPISRDNSNEKSPNLKSPGLSLKIKNEAETMTGPRDRVHTISVMSPVQQNINRRSSKEIDTSYSFPKSSGLCPKFVFLQWYYNSMIVDKCPEIKSSYDFETHDKTKPIVLPKNEAIDRSLKNLDRITPYETHKIGVLYVGPDQAKDTTAIWSNPFGSLRYIQFLKGLGKLIRLEDADTQVSYVGGLDVKGQDGKYAISWEDNLIQVIFHVATLMPTKMDTDPNCNNKKKHIGNDFVCIVYNESGSTVNMSTIKGDGQFIQAIVVITPFEYNSNLVMIQAKDDFLNLIGHYDSQMLSDSALPVFVRQLALHANLGSMVYNGAQSATTTQTQHVSNWVQRLKQIKRIRQRVTNKSATDQLVRNPTNESNEDTNSGVNPQTGDIKSQYIFPDFNDYS